MLAFVTRTSLMTLPYRCFWGVFRTMMFPCLLVWADYCLNGMVFYSSLVRINWTFFCVKILKPKKIFRTFPYIKVLISSSPKMEFFIFKNFCRSNFFWSRDQKIYVFFWWKSSDKISSFLISVFSYICFINNISILVIFLYLIFMCQIILFLNYIILWT